MLSYAPPMGPLRRDEVSGIPARAYVVPAQTGSVGENENNLRADSRVRCTTLLVVTSAADGLPCSPDPTLVGCRLANWLRIVLYHAGSGEEVSRDLPPAVHLPVIVEPTSRRIVAVDVDLAERELAPYREVGRRQFLRTESTLAPVRTAIALPGEAIGFARGLAGEWRRSIREFRSGSPRSPGAAGEPHAPAGLGPPAWSPEEVEQARVTALTVRAHLAKRPKERERHRASALVAGPMQAANVRGGSMHPVDFEHWLMYQEVSGVLSAEEVADLRRQATPDPPRSADE